MGLKGIIMNQRAWHIAVLLFGGLILCGAVFLASCGDPSYVETQEKSPEEIKVIKAVDK